MKKFFILLALLTLSAHAQQSFDFTKSGDLKSREIVQAFFENEINPEQLNIVSYFCDLDNDHNKEIIAIIKTNSFHTLAGYKLIALKLDETGYWKMLPSDVYFDDTKGFAAGKNKIKYHGSNLYKNKKFIAKLKNGKITTKKSFSDKRRDKRAKNVANFAGLMKVDKAQNMDLEHFPSNAQASKEIIYKNLSEKTKRYLDQN